MPNPVTIPASHVVARSQPNEEQHGEHDFTDCFMAYFVILAIDGPLAFPDFLIKEGNIIGIIILYVHIAHVFGLMQEQPYNAEAHFILLRSNMNGHSQTAKSECTLRHF